jgi:hypothetical protein
VGLVESCITAERCAERFPGSTRTETIFRDTVIITNSQHFDTLFRFSADTIFLKDEKTKIEVRVIRIKGDSIFIQSKCPPDTIMVEKIRTETTIERIRNIVVNQGERLLWVLAILTLAVFGIGYLIKQLKK